MKTVERKNYNIVYTDPEIYVDNESRGRSGHMSHAMVEFAPNKIIDFNSNCSPVRCDGHSAFGWIEYRISEDGGKTFGEVNELPYSKEAFVDGVFTVSVEKAVACNDGRIVAFCTRNSQFREICCEPWLTPMVVISNDGGKSWMKPTECSPFRGRVYDAVYHDDVIYMLQFCNDAEIDWCGNLPEHQYRLFASYNNGESFEEVCVVPIENIGRAYGSLLFDNNGNLHAYAYNVNCEQEMEHVISTDLGKNWKDAGTCHLNMGIRNPQTAFMDNVYILHGRGDNGKGLVLYTSEDGHNWDEGFYISTKKAPCHYSNNIILKNSNGENRLLIQYSDTYYKGCVNVRHMWLQIDSVT